MMPTTQIHKSGEVVPFRAPSTTPSTPLLTKFTAHVSRAKTTDAIVYGIEEFAPRLLPVNVFRLGTLPQRTSDWRLLEAGKDVLLHSCAAFDWSTECAAKVEEAYAPGIMM